MCVPIPLFDSSCSFLMEIDDSQGQQDAGGPGNSFRIGMAVRAATTGTAEKKTDVARGPIRRTAILRQDMPTTLGTKP